MVVVAAAAGGGGGGEASDHNNMPGVSYSPSGSPMEDWNAAGVGSVDVNGSVKLSQTCLKNSGSGS